MRTEQLLDESVLSARTRELSTIDELLENSSGRIVLFGAGVLGKKVHLALRQEGIVPLAFVDNNSALHSRIIDGLVVLSMDEAVEKWGNKAVFVCCIFHPLGGQGMNDHLRILSRHGCSNVSSFLPLAWKYSGVLPHYGADLPSHLLAHASELKKVAALWTDPDSQETFRQQLSWRIRADFSTVGLPTSHQYFPPDIVVPRADERFVDCGAYDGDTLKLLPLGFESAWAIEPDPSSYLKLQSAVDSRVRTFCAALGSDNGIARFNAKGTPASSRSDQGRSEVLVQRLDDILIDVEPTFVKLDVEGDELETLIGCTQTLKRSKPVVAACVYHRPSDLWEIPLFLKQLLPEHRLFLRAHEYDGFELVTYAVREDRCR